MSPARRYLQPEPEPEQSPVFKAVLIIVGLLIGTFMVAARCDTGGHYAGGEGSSHKGGHYENSATNNHYRKR